MGGTTLPTPSTPGYGTYTDAAGKKWTCCDCLAQWLPVYERLLLARGLIKSNIDVWQLTGGATASGGTHSQGGAFDLLYQTGAAYVAVAREMGAPATWTRTVAQGFTKAHTHGVLSGCPHNEPAAYQITAQRRGYNGLGQGATGTPYARMWGYGFRDEFPDPKTYRTWREGIAWAEAQIKALTPAPEEDPMPTPAELWNVKFESPLDATKSYTAEQWLTMANVKAGDAKAIASKALAQITALTAAFKALAANPTITLEQITAAAKAGADAALDERISDADVTLTVDPT